MLEQSISIQPPTSRLANKDKTTTIASRCFTFPTFLLISLHSLLRKSIRVQQNWKVYYHISSAEEFKLLNSQERKKKKKIKPQLLNLEGYPFRGLN